jgi:hypothetical protein
MGKFILNIAINIAELLIAAEIVKAINNRRK